MLIPCMDLERGCVVQRVRGRRRVLRLCDVMAVAERFWSQPWLHVIDLDAAERRGSNWRLVRALCRKARAGGPQIRVGGGLRTLRRVERVLDWGAAQVIVGTAAFTRRGVHHRFLSRLAHRVGRERVIIAVDTRGGSVVVEGWRKKLALPAERALPELEPYCAGFLCTSVDTEGTLAGAPLAWFRKLRRLTPLPVIAAGVIRSWWEIRCLERWGMDAAVGLALYRGWLELPASATAGRSASRVATASRGGSA